MVRRAHVRRLIAAISVTLASVWDPASAAILVTEDQDVQASGDSSVPVVPAASVLLLQKKMRLAQKNPSGLDGGLSENQNHDQQGISSKYGVGRGEGLADALAEYKLYHNSDSMISKLQKMEKDCGVPMETEWLKDKESDGKLFSVKVGNPKADKTVMVAANEHARELLTGEVALRFIEMACDKEKGASLLEAAETSAKQLLENVNFLVLPIINKKGRELVETNKQICQRMTSDDEGGVDLNRNMEVDWGKGDEQKWGPKPFSAYQTRIMRDVAKDVQPISFVDLHTGARSLMTSWGYKRKATTDLKDQAKVLEKVKEKHCEDCKVGPNSIVIGYPNPGEIIDHMYASQGIKYTTLWELFEGAGDTCLSQFTPKDGEYEKYVSNWATALYTLGNYMDTKVNKSERSHPDVIPFNSSLLGVMEPGSGLLEASAHAATNATETGRFPYT